MAICNRKLGTCVFLEQDVLNNGMLPLIHHGKPLLIDRNMT